MYINWQLSVLEWKNVSCTRYQEHDWNSSNNLITTHFNCHSSIRYLAKFNFSLYLQFAHFTRQLCVWRKFLLKELGKKKLLLKELAIYYRMKNEMRKSLQKNCVITYIILSFRECISTSKWANTQLITTRSRKKRNSPTCNSEFDNCSSKSIKSRKNKIIKG